MEEKFEEVSFEFGFEDDVQMYFATNTDNYEIEKRQLNKIDINSEIRDRIQMVCEITMVNFFYLRIKSGVNHLLLQKDIETCAKRLIEHDWDVGKTLESFDLNETTLDDDMEELLNLNSVEQQAIQCQLCFEDIIVKVIGFIKLIILLIFFFRLRK